MSAPATRNGQAAADPRRSTYFSWEEFDRLPKLIRDLMNYTPHAVGTGFVFRQIMDGGDIRAVARSAYVRWRGYARAETLRLYGPTHPQLQEDVSAA